MKDHEIAHLVNELRNIAVKYGGTEQLRARVAQCITPHLQQLQAVQEENRVLQKQLGERWLETAALKSELERLADAERRNAELKSVDPSKENKLFEAWARTQPSVSLRLCDIGLYLSRETGLAHDAWQYRAALNPKPEAASHE